MRFIVQMLTGRLLEEAIRRIGQPSVMGQLLAGLSARSGRSSSSGFFPLHGRA
jgi:Kef-type K+ transport system membrane component KefB